MAVESYEYSTFLVGIELPVTVEEREDEFKAAFKSLTARAYATSSDDSWKDHR